MLTSVQQLGQKLSWAAILSAVPAQDIPKYLPGSCRYLTMMGSHAYGVADEDSDIDLYGFVVPPKEIIFPHLQGCIPGFDHPPLFEQWQYHHLELAGVQLAGDCTVYNIVKYFSLLMVSNPNMVDSLLTPDQCIIHKSPISDLVRSERKLFLHKGAYHKFLGYAHSQLNKLDNKQPQKSEKRRRLIRDHGFDSKYAYHLVRLMRECEQILQGDLQLDNNVQELRAIRDGEWSLQQVKDVFHQGASRLEDLYKSSSLQYSPDVQKIKQLLLKCLEIEYGSLKVLGGAW